MKKIFGFLFSRLFVFGVCIAAQVAILVLMILYLSSYGVYFYIGFTLFGFVTILYIASTNDNPLFKLSWILPIALFPILGWALYFLIGHSHMPKKAMRKSDAVYAKAAALVPQDQQTLHRIQTESPAVARQVAYLRNTTRLPVYPNTETEYLTPGEAFFEALCDELNRAEHFILMEYFIVSHGVMWDRVLEILLRKAREGVEVKLVYDDIGCICTLPNGYDKTLRAAGIQVHVFNVFRPSVNAFMNFRDHRKITVIDGKVGFTGGCNLSDEYINAVDKHGHWKDSSILLRGEAVWSLTVLFLQLWEYAEPDSSNPIDYYRPVDPSIRADGYVMPYGDGPLDNDLIGENVYRGMIVNAVRYVSITTPYLILDNEMHTALTMAAQSGVKVRIITPGNADKWYVHMMTRYNYRNLIAAGVEIYEYQGGFIHAKTIVCDDEVAVVGTQNFDFRSFYLHFECGVYLYRTGSVAQVLKDHEQTLSRCRRITLEECRRVNPFIRFFQSCLNLFAPLM